MRCVARFGTICTIQKAWKTSMEECYFQWSCRLKAFTKSETPPWVFFTFFKLYKRYQIAQHITYSQFDDSKDPSTALRKNSFTEGV